MKNTILIIITGLCIHPLFSQDEIYKGGFGDGWASSSFQQANNNIFQGGVGDGWSSFSLQQPDSNIYNGGIGDAWSNDDTTFQLVEVSVTENELGTLLKAWPNPTDGTINVDLGETFQDITVEIYSIAGMLIDKKQYSSMRQNICEIAGAQGVYIIRVSTGTNEAIIRITKR